MSDYFLIVALFLLFDAILTSQSFFLLLFYPNRALPVNTIIGCNLRPTKWFYFFLSRDALNAIFKAIYFFFLPIFTDSDFLSKYYNWQHIQT